VYHQLEHSCAAGYNPVPPEFYFTTDSSLAVPTILSPVTNIVGDTVAYRTEGFPGDTIRFTMRAVDPYVHPDCTPQKISMEARGGNLSSAANYGNANACLFNPPCATTHLIKPWWCIHLSRFERCPIQLEHYV